MMTQLQVVAVNFNTGEMQIGKIYGAAAAALMAHSVSQDARWHYVAVHNMEGKLLVQFA